MVNISMNNLMYIPNHNFNDHIEVHHMETSLFNKLNFGWFMFFYTLIKAVRNVFYINLFLHFCLTYLEYVLQYSIGYLKYKNF